MGENVSQLEIETGLHEYLSLKPWKVLPFDLLQKKLKYIIPQTRPPHYVWFLPEPCKSYEVCAFINSILSFDDHATTVFVKI